MSELDEKFLTKKELADRWKVTTRTIENMVMRGDCPPPKRFGYRTVRWPVDVITAHEKSGK